MVALAVRGNLTIAEIVEARDYALSEAARPAFGRFGVWITVGFAVVATVSGVIASVFAVSRMLAMLTDMKLVPHSHFGMPGDIQKHALVYTIILAMLLTLLFDLGRIASLGAIFYLILDFVIHLGIYRHLRHQIGANGTVLLIALGLDAVVLGAFVWVKITTDLLVIWASLLGLGGLFAGERLYLRRRAL